MNKKELIKLLKILVLKLQKILLGMKVTIPNSKDPEGVIIHHGGGWLDFKGVNNYHRIKWGFKSSLGYYIGYHAFIERSGELIIGRADDEEAAHCVDPNRPGYYNKNWLGVCLMGNGVEKDFTKEQYKTLKTYLNNKRIKYGIPLKKIKGHSEIKSTICPSDKVMNWLKQYRNQ